MITVSKVEEGDLTEEQKARSSNIMDLSDKIKDLVEAQGKSLHIIMIMVDAETRASAQVVCFPKGSKFGYQAETGTFQTASPEPEAMLEHLQIAAMLLAVTRELAAGLTSFIQQAALDMAMAVCAYNKMAREMSKQEIAHAETLNKRGS